MSGHSCPVKVTLEMSHDTMEIPYPHTQHPIQAHARPGPRIPPAHSLRARCVSGFRMSSDVRKVKWYKCHILPHIPSEQFSGKLCQYFCSETWIFNVTEICKLQLSSRQFSSGFAANELGQFYCHINKKKPFFVFRHILRLKLDTTDCVPILTVIKPWIGTQMSFWLHTVL